MYIIYYNLIYYKYIIHYIYKFVFRDSQFNFLVHCILHYIIFSLHVVIQVFIADIQWDTYIISWRWQFFVHTKGHCQRRGKSRSSHPQNYLFWLKVLINVRCPWFKKKYRLFCILHAIILMSAQTQCKYKIFENIILNICTYFWSWLVHTCWPVEGTHIIM